MTIISPLLQNKLNSQNFSKGNKNLDNRHEKIYQDLQKRAHEAKPNEAKAVLVNEGILGNPITAVKDIAKDTKNFFTAVKTGQMGDNNLGRINDLGLKIGAALIATGLALHSKTKTDSIMRFIGGATFIGAMSLWPKLFINLPAKLVHGFRIDRKYISAQGDKKDFFLDNQFLVWDAYPEEQLRQDAKKAGIDYDSKNGKEKIQRKMQKTALQNRALWMATAGFSTPLLTAMVGNFVEPAVKEAVILNGVKKVQNQVGPKGENLATYLGNIKPEVKNVKELETFIANKGNAEVLDGKFFEDLTQVIFPNDILESFKDPDNGKPILKFAPNNFSSELKKIYEKLAVVEQIDLEKINTILDNLYPKTQKDAAVDSIASLFEGAEFKGITHLDGKEVDVEAIKNAIAEALNGEKKSINEVRGILLKNYIPKDQVNEILAGAKINKKDFFEFVEKYNKGPVAELRAKLKGYLNVINPIVGSKDESLYTSNFRKTMKKVFKGLGIDSAKEAKILKGQQSPETIKKLSELISSKVKELTPEKYGEFIQSLMADEIPEDVKSLIESFQNETNLDAIMPSADSIPNVNVKALNKALAGGAGASDGILGNLKNFVQAKVTDLDAVRTKAVLAANFERRIASGDLELSEEQLKIARKFVYDGSIPTIIASVRRDTVDQAKYKAVLEKVFDSSKFADEKGIIPNIENIVDNLRAIGGSEKSIVTPTVDYMSCGSFAQHIKGFATSLSNNKAWMKIFAPMTIALIAITLLVQPLFGKIDKEFPEEGKNGGAK